MEEMDVDVKSEMAAFSSERLSLVSLIFWSIQHDDLLFLYYIQYLCKIIHSKEILNEFNI